MGFEPTTAGATIQSSAELSYGHHMLLRTASIANGLGIVNSHDWPYKPLARVLSACLHGIKLIAGTTLPCELHI
jgi:hypothetical protein